MNAQEDSLAATVTGPVTQMKQITSSQTTLDLENGLGLSMKGNYKITTEADGTSYLDLEFNADIANESGLGARETLTYTWQLRSEKPDAQGSYIYETCKQMVTMRQSVDDINQWGDLKCENWSTTYDNIDPAVNHVLTYATDVWVRDDANSYVQGTDLLRSGASLAVRRPTDAFETQTQI